MERKKFPVEMAERALENLKKLGLKDTPSRRMRLIRSAIRIHAERALRAEEAA